MFEGDEAVTQWSADEGDDAGDLSFADSENVADATEDESDGEALEGAEDPASVDHTEQDETQE